MRSKSLVPLRLGAVALAVLGVFPLAMVIKNAPVVAWLPAAAVGWLLSGAVLVGAALVIAQFTWQPSRCAHRSAEGLGAGADTA